MLRSRACRSALKITARTMKNQHHSEWVKYQKLSATDKAFFNKRKGTIQEVAGKSVEALKFTIWGPIVEVLIGELFSNQKRMRKMKTRGQSRKQMR
jgi:hypothetical protein